MLNCDLFAIHYCLKRSQFFITTNIVNDKNCYKNIVNSVMNDIVKDKKGHNIVNDSFADKPDGFLVEVCI